MPERPLRELGAERLLDGFLFGEGLRWMGDRLVFSDMIGRRVLSFDPARGETRTLAEVEQQPNGLGVLPDGRLAITSMFDNRVYVADVSGRPALAPLTRQVAPPELELLADLADLVTGYLGDAVVDRHGRLYVGDTGIRLFHGEALDGQPGLTGQPGLGRDRRRGRGRLIRVDGPGHAAVVLENLDLPNGMVISPDGQTLYLALSGDATVVQCRIATDGDLGPPRPFVRQLADGMVGDRAGGVWMCVPHRDRGVVRSDLAGRLTTRVRAVGITAIACALDPAEETLYFVGIEALPRGVDIFAAIRAGRTRGSLWRADVRAT